MSKGSIYRDKESSQKYHAMHDEQRHSFRSIKKVFLRKVDENHEPMRDENGKIICTLKLRSDLSLIGFID